MVKIKINDGFILNNRLFILYGIHLVCAIILLATFDRESMDVMDAAPLPVRITFAYAVISTMFIATVFYSRAIVGYQILERLKDSGIPFYSLPFSNEYVVGYDGTEGTLDLSDVG